MQLNNALTLLIMVASKVTCMNLNVTAISAANGESIFECWQLDTPFSISTKPGREGTATVALGSVSNVTYAVIPAGVDEGPHVAPRKQWVMFTSGLALFTLPADNTTEVLIVGGALGLIFAADTADVTSAGHGTRFPGVAETTALTIPTEGNSVPDHQVLHSGPCTAEDFLGNKILAAGSS